MSFSTRAKDELARILPEKECCQLAELAALARMDGSINISAGRRVGLQIRTENAAVARKIFRLAKNLLDPEMEIRVQKRTCLRKTNLYHVHLLPHPGMSGFLKRLGIIKGDGSIFPGIKQGLVKSQCCRRSYLRGAFLGAGSVSSPEGNYHLEIIAGDAEYASSLASLVNRFEGMQARVGSRKRSHIVYLKESDQISAFLNIIGAHQALLDFENIRIIKGMRNQVNRLVNCETANLSKTVNASLKQVENIRFIDRVIGIEKLPARLKAIARLRLENPDASLKELGEMMDPPIGKSGANHRMRRIDEIAEELRSRFQR